MAIIDPGTASHADIKAASATDIMASAAESSETTKVVAVTTLALGAAGEPMAPGLTFRPYKADAASAVPGEWWVDVMMSMAGGPQGSLFARVRCADVLPPAQLASLDEIYARIHAGAVSQLSK